MNLEIQKKWFDMIVRNVFTKPYSKSYVLRVLRLIACRKRVIMWYHVIIRFKLYKYTFKSYFSVLALSLALTA